MQDPTELANAVRGGFDHTLGLAFTRVSEDEVCATVPVGPGLLQPYGLVHGGVYAGIVETVCSTGGGVWAYPRGLGCVGLDNHTQFLRGTRAGTLHARAVPVHRGRRTQVWTAEILDDQGRRVATGTVRLLVVAEGEAVGEAPVGLTPPG